MKEKAVVHLNPMYFIVFSQRISETLDSLAPV